MKLSRLITFVLASVISLLVIVPTVSIAADAARVTGDMKVDGLWFSGDPSKTIIRNPSDFSAPWTIFGSDIYYLTGNIGIGTMTPTAKLEVNGTVKSTLFNGDGSGLTNVTASSVTNGAVSDAQISGTISATKLDLSTVQKKYGKVAVVAKSGGDYSDPAAAMSAVSTWCGTPSASNPCLVKIMPGIYDIGSNSSVVMKMFVDIEGSGENTTVITGAIGSAFEPYTGVVAGASNAEIRFLTIKSISNRANLVALYNNSASPKVTNVTLSTTGGTEINHGVFNIFNGSSPVLTNVTIVVFGGAGSYGIFNAPNSSLTLNNVIINASGGWNFNVGVFNNLGISSIMANTTIKASGGLESYGIYNGVTASSPSIINVVANASGASDANYGVFSLAPSTVITNSTVSASGGTNSYGVYVASSAIINMVNATATGGVNNYGIYNTSAAITLNNVNATANGVSKSYGLYNSATSGSYIINIDRSVFSGATNSILSDTHFTLRLGASKLVGPVNTVDGTYICAGVYNDSYVMLNTSCQ